MSKKVRVRFAPSPTGGLHLGGVRTVLYNYLFAKHHGGDFILRIEDTDQNRFVAGAEDYVFDCLTWAGLEPDESPRHGGDYGPYRQSERKEIYRKYAEDLIAKGFAYYAFDTPAELEAMRHNHKTDNNPSPQYDHSIRTRMRNSLTLTAAETQILLTGGTPHVIRIRVPDNETVVFNDLIRGDVSFDTNVVDDKVLLKADGMPTYHLAVVVDDHLMEITHAFRGEEWLPSAPVHVLLWKYLFGIDKMPRWAHLPLILGPNGKLSKRDGAKYGFPVFAMSWTDPKTGELTEGFKERGFLPEAFINLLALLGWNDGTEKEIFSKQELIERFAIDRVHSGGAKFDYEKAKWFNHEWIKNSSPASLMASIQSVITGQEFASLEAGLLERIILLVKDRCTLLADFHDQLLIFVRRPPQYDLAAVKPKWNPAKQEFFEKIILQFESAADWNASSLEGNFKEAAGAENLKPGDVLLPLRVMLVGGKSGPGVFDIAELLGRTETIDRMRLALPHFAST